MQRRKIRILAIDDDLDMLSLYARSLGRLGYRVDRTSNPGEANRMASETMYDVAICDVKLKYRSAPFGGLILAEELARRSGRNAVLLVSGAVYKSEIDLSSSSLSFLPKPKDSSEERWCTIELHQKLQWLIERQYGFVVMPFGKDDVDVMYKNGLRKGAMKAGFDIKSMNKVHFSKLILEKTRNMIEDAHFVVLMTVDGNANAFYEAGFAHALDKHLVVCAPAAAEVPFNVRGFQYISYQDADALHRELCEKLTGMRHH